LPQVSPLPLPASASVEAVDPNLVAPAAPNNYRIGVDDLLSVYVYQVPEMTREVMVDRGGNIQLPFLRGSVAAAGHTSLEVSEELDRALSAEGMVRSPRTQVIVRQVLSKPIVMTGAVETPQTLQASRPMTLLEALSRADGLAQNAGDVAVISSLAEPDAAAERVELAPLLRGEAGARNPVLQGDQMVRVVPAGQVVVVGALQEPGAFLLQTGRPITILGAIALAHGIKQPASPKGAQILRRRHDGSMSSQPVNVDLILKHKLPDTQMEDGDILYIPTSGARTIVTTVLQDVGQAAVIAVGYH